MTAIVVGDEVTIVGNIISNGNVQVQGNVQGHVFCTNINICDGGQVAGGIVAENVTVYGRVSGPINAMHVSLESGSHAASDICHRSLKLADESCFEGRSRHSENPLLEALSDIEQAKRPSTPPPAPAPAAKSKLPQLPPAHPRRRPRGAASAGRLRGRATSSMQPVVPQERRGISEDSRVKGS